MAAAREGGFGPESRKKIARPWGERIHGEVERWCVPRAAKNRTTKRESAIPKRLLIIYKYGGAIRSPCSSTE